MYDFKNGGLGVAPKVLSKVPSNDISYNVCGKDNEWLKLELFISIQLKMTGVWIFGYFTYQKCENALMSVTSQIGKPNY